MTNVIGELTLGVLGGMGPDATINFLSEVISRTPTTSDQDHIEMIIHNDPKIPDRNEAILGDGDSPLPRLRRNLEKLVVAGSDLIAIPCNTAHFYYDQLNSCADVDILHIVEECRKEVQSRGFHKVGLLSTETVMEIGLYRNEFKTVSIDIVHPNNKEYLMESIYSLKEGNRNKAQCLLDSVVSDLETKGVEALLVGCSDLSVLKTNTRIPVFDPTTILAKSCIDAVKQISQEAK